MEERNVGRSGLRVSAVGLGCNNFAERLDLQQTRAVVDAAIDLGITLFDTADVYGGFGGSEDFLGQCLGERRKQVVLATKFGVPMHASLTRKNTSRAYILRAVEDSLRRLRTDWIDLYQLHRPDDSTPIDETLRALDDLVRSGKVRYIGCSNLPAWQVVDAQWTSRHLGLEAFNSSQDEYSLLVRGAEAELIPALRASGMGLVPYFPLAGGLLSGKYKRGQPLPAGRIAATQRYVDRFLTERNWSVVGKLDAFCQERGRTLLELAFSWLAAQPVVASVIAGASTPDQLRQNARAAEWKLTAEELAQVDAITRG
jgi:aryl-alcohol dehydrogenase-like predicted oxidoreductase